jgi:LemA protein
MLTWTIVAAVAVVLAVAAFVFNKLVRSAQIVSEAWSGIDVQLRRRAELVPMLIDTIKGYMVHEREVLQRLVELRTAAQSLPPADVAQRAKAESDISAALGRLMAIAEGYPDLKASDNFLSLQKELSVLEDELQMARRYFNGAVRDLNTLVQSFPSNLVAALFGFTERSYFEITSAGERAAPQVAL